MLTLAAQLEALLFISGEPMAFSRLGTLLKVSPGELEEAIVTLSQNLEGRGITVLRTHDSLTLATSPEAAELIAKLKKDELERELSKASLETLSIILYKNGATRSDIDYIRGVNSSFILRNLAIRGLVERVENPADKRTFLYKPTADLLAHLGLPSIEQLPNFAEYTARLGKEAQQSIEPQVTQSAEESETLPVTEETIE
jgi:segregation and condensation protein B